MPNSTIENGTFIDPNHVNEGSNGGGLPPNLLFSDEGARIPEGMTPKSPTQKVEGAPPPRPPKSPPPEIGMGC